MLTVESDTLMLSLMNDNYVIDIVQLSGIYGSKPPSPRVTARGRGLFTLLESTRFVFSTVKFTAEVQGLALALS